MAGDIPIERDLSLIFERDDVTDYFAGHCAKAHVNAEAVRRCQYCQQLRGVLAEAIIEWLEKVVAHLKEAAEFEGREANQYEALYTKAEDALRRIAQFEDRGSADEPVSSGIARETLAALASQRTQGN